MRRLGLFVAILAVLVISFSASVATTTEPIPTAKQVEGWEKVEIESGSCGLFIFYGNPDPSSKHLAGYVHYCLLHRGKLYQYGVWDGRRLREFNTLEDGTWLEFFRSNPSLEQKMREITRKAPRLI